MRKDQDQEGSREKKFHYKILKSAEKKRNIMIYIMGEELKISVTLSEKTSLELCTYWIKLWKLKKWWQFIEKKKTSMNKCELTQQCIWK